MNFKWFILFPSIARLFCQIRNPRNLRTPCCLFLHLKLHLTVMQGLGSYSVFALGSLFWNPSNEKERSNDNHDARHIVSHIKWDTFMGLILMGHATTSSTLYQQAWEAIIQCQSENSPSLHLRVLWYQKLQLMMVIGTIFW